MDSATDSEISGIIDDGVLNVIPDITDRTLLTGHGPYLIYKAKRYGKWVKLKALKAEFRGNPLYEEGLRKEFLIGVQLEHPFLARTDQFIQDTELGNSILMEYVHGVTLDKWLEGDGKCKPGRRQRALIADQLIKAVRYMHDNGVLHRDIKPTNIIITSIGESVKLIDFGLSDAASFAILKQAAGTAGYIAPELSSGASSSCKSDVYSLGKVIGLLKPGLKYRRAISRATAKNPDSRLESVSLLQNTVRHSEILGRTFMYAGIAAAFTFAVTVGTKGLVRSSFNNIEQDVQTKQLQYQSAIAMADSLLTIYYDSLNTLIQESPDVIACNSACIAYFNAKGYPMQHVDSITSICTASFDLATDLQSQLFSHLERESNTLYQSRYHTPLTDKFGK